MGKTVEAYRLALEEEIRRWRGFALGLRCDEREAFEAVLDACRRFASASSNAVQPVIFEPMVMSVLVSLQLRIQSLEKELDVLRSKLP